MNESLGLQPFQSKLEIGNNGVDVTETSLTTDAQSNGVGGNRLWYSAVDKNVRGPVNSTTQPLIAKSGR